MIKGTISKPPLIPQIILERGSGSQSANFANHNRNAGLFIWIDLSPHLRSEDTQRDAWAAERLLSARFAQAGVIMSTGEQYHAPEPGKFRIIFSVGEETLREGIRRFVQCAQM